MTHKITANTAFLIAASLAAVTALGCSGDDSNEPTNDTGTDTDTADVSGDLGDDVDVADTTTDAADDAESDTQQDPVIDVADDTANDAANDTDVVDDTTVDPDVIDDTTADTGTDASDRCTPDPCGANGACEPATGSCACNTGYAGDLCDQCGVTFQDNDGNGTCEVDCSRFDCGENMACNDSVGAAMCECVDRFVFDSDGVCVAVPDCIDDVLFVGVPVSGSLAADVSDASIVSSCGLEEEAATDNLYTFVASDGGLYTFATSGETDTVISVHEGLACDGAELVCNDDSVAGDDGNALSFVNLRGGQVVTVVVDGYDVSETGEYTIVADYYGADACGTSTDLGSELGVGLASGDLADERDQRTGSCGDWGTGPEAYFRWTAPTAGDFQFSTGGEADSVLYLIDGCTSDANELACNDDIEGGDELTSLLTLAMTADQFVIIVVDSWGPDTYTLDIIEAP